MKIPVYDIKGKKTEEFVNTKILGQKENASLLAEALYIFESRTRQVSAKAKDRSDVAGGGRKPWKQKGTGRARAGSSRSPLWRGGGVTFGPTGQENFQLSIPKKKKKLALKSALAFKKAEDIVVVKNYKMTSISTKKATEFLKSLGLGQKTLVINDAKEDQVIKSFENIKDIELKNYASVNIKDILKAKKILFLNGSLALLEKKLETKNGTN